MWNFTDNPTLDIVVNSFLILQLLSIFGESYGDAFWKKRPCYRYFLMWVGMYVIYLSLDILRCLSVGLDWETAYVKGISILYNSAGCVIYFAPILWAVEIARERQYVSDVKVWTILGTIFVADLAILIMLGINAMDFDDVIPSLDWQIQTGLRHYEVLIVLIYFYIVLSLYKSIGFKTSVYLLALVLLPSAMRKFLPWERVPEAIGTVAITYFIYMNVMQRRKVEYAEQQTELASTRVALIRSQIQPHFLYNSLSAIAALCDIDPQKARQTTLDFSTYLERNLDSLTESKPVPFLKELSHVEAYLRIEQTRFGDMLQVSYQIRTTDFFIPSLTVQPLVENAVKHGVGHAENGGTVSIATSESNASWFIIVTDDGVGFDPENPEIKGHGIGLAGIRQRLELQCKGTLTIESAPGKGTRAVISIPKGVVL